jgi:hypothetical protein
MFNAIVDLILDKDLNIILFKFKKIKIK